MKDFNELFVSASEVADKRKAVFNQLIEKTKKEILPEFANAFKNFDISKVYFKTNTKSFEGQTKQNPECFPDIDGYNVFQIDVKENTIKEVEYVYDGFQLGYEDGYTSVEYTFDNVPLLKTGILEFVKQLNSRLTTYIQKYDEKNLEAESLIKK